MKVIAHPPGPRAEKTVLANGVRVLSETLGQVDSVSLGLWLNSGVVDDPPGQDGLTHLLEHMVFKGTRTRSSRRIAETIDDIGGNVNGLTDREMTYLYARTTADHVEQALELLGDMLLNSVCAARDLAKEKEVVLQEIRLVEDTPEDWVHDVLLEAAWPEHPLGRPVIGKAETLAGIDRRTLVRHLDRLRVGANLLVTAAGRVEHAALVRAVEKLTAALPAGAPFAPAAAPQFAPGKRLVSRPTNQVHLCLAAPACECTGAERHVYGVLDTLFGGGTSSRLFHEIRETRGLAYNIGSYLQLYRNAGLFTVDAGTGPEHFQEVLDLIAKEMARMRRQGPTAAEVTRAKTQTRVALSLAAESTSFRMQHLAISELCWGRTLSFEEIAAGVSAVTAEDVHALARRVFVPEQQALVAIGPFGRKRR